MGLLRRGDAGLPVRPWTRRNDPEGLRARILDEAARLFQECGYHSTSVHDLMEASEVSAGASHHHFTSKKSIGLAVLTDRVRPAVHEPWIEPIRAAPALGRGIAKEFESFVAGIQSPRVLCAVAR